MGVQSSAGWAELISGSSAAEEPVVAYDYLRALQSASKPIVVRDDARQPYVVKVVTNPYGNGHAIYLEHIVARFGRLIGAPVPEVVFVEIDAELLEVMDVRIGDEPVSPGIHHGSRWEGGFSDRAGLEHLADNRQRFGALCVLYTWLRCTTDHQFLYADRRPHRVLSVDHSAFLAPKGEWDEATLASLAPLHAMDPYFDPVGLTEDDLAPALDRLENVSPEEIAQVLSQPPHTWNVALAERAALAEVLYRGQDELLWLQGRCRKV